MNRLISNTLNLGYAAGLFEGSAGRVARAVGKKLKEFRESNRVSDDRIRFLQTCFAQAECPWIDYDQYAVDFAFAYFLQNFWKSYLIFLEHEPRVVRRMLDIGCGSGATSLAYLAYLNEHLAKELGAREHKRRFEIRGCFLDKSLAQLQLLDELLMEVEPELPHVVLDRNFAHQDVRRWQNDADKYDLILHGHVLTENRTQVGSILDHSLTLSDEEARLYAIERETDTVWKEIEIATDVLGLERRFSSTEALLSPIIARTGERNEEENLIAKCVVLKTPERTELRRLLLLYFQAWRQQDASLLEEIFTPDAKYSEKPFSAPLTGLRQIQRYWAEKVLCQRAISIQLGLISYTNDEAIAEWHARFMSNGTPTDVKGFLVITVDPFTHKVASLREYYRTQRG